MYKIGKVTSFITSFTITERTQEMSQAYFGCVLNKNKEAYQSPKII